MENLLQIEKTEITVGLKKEYHFLQVSDTHIAYTDENSSQVDIDDNKRSRSGWNMLKREFAEKFGETCPKEHDELEPHVLFEALATYANEKEVDALILSGDIMDRVTESNLRYLRKYLASYPRRVVYCLGNHAWHDEYGEHRNMYSRFEGIVANPEFDSFDFDEFKIITIDNGMKNITDTQVERLCKELEEDKRILLVLHAPIKLGEFAEKTGDKINNYFFMGAPTDCENAHKLVKLVKDNDKKFIAVLAGHVHGALEYPITDNLIQYTASSGLIGYGREIILK